MVRAVEHVEAARVAGISAEDLPRIIHLMNTLIPGASEPEENRDVPKL